jgi:primosomal protein N' (replication factor Y)
MKCHYCAHRARDLAACTGCGGELFVMKGAGTQRVEAELARLFPKARVVRMDVDSTRRRGSHAKFLAAFEAGEVDILLGTQMVAKGFDFPSVTLVGVVNADTQLNLPDFRAAERTFQLLTQVAGRAGRGERAGEVVIQTQSADHYALLAASKQDYGAFYERELAERKEVSYPPFRRLLNVLIDGKDEARVIEAADRARKLLEKAERERAGRSRAEAPTPPGPGGGDLEILGPAPQPLSRLRGQHRWHLTLKSADHRTLAESGERLLREAVPDLPPGVRLALDVDPVHLL